MTLSIDQSRGIKQSLTLASSNRALNTCHANALHGHSSQEKEVHMVHGGLISHETRIVYMC